jgi:hypothetical protein
VVAPGFVRKIKPPRILRDVWPVYRESFRSKASSSLNHPVRIRDMAASASQNSFYSDLTKTVDKPSSLEDGEAFHAPMLSSVLGPSMNNALKWSAKKGSAFGSSMPSVSLPSFAVRWCATPDASESDKQVKRILARIVPRWKLLAQWDESDEEMDADGTNATAAAFAANAKVESTQAGELANGEDIVVSLGYTGHEYTHEEASERTVLCMSIWEDMKFLPLLDTFEKNGGGLAERLG